MTTAAHDSALSAAIRPEIAKAAGPAYSDGRWDDAIFDAFRTVEAALQVQTGSSLIGNGLVNLAFDGNAPRLRISGNPSDLSRLAELYRGALGFLKGDRSHKDRPAVPCPDAQSCARSLAFASYLLDLLDQDANAAPAITAIRPDGEHFLELETLRASADTTAEVNGADAQVVSREGRRIRIQLPPGAGRVEVRLREGRRIGAPVSHVPSPAVEDDNFHLVEQPDLRSSTRPRAEAPIRSQRCA
jgi:hypothetical protein